MPDQPPAVEPKPRPSWRRSVTTIVLAVSCGSAAQHLILRPQPHALGDALFLAGWMALVMGVSAFVGIRHPEVDRRLTWGYYRDRRRRRQQHP